jgi:serine/threonine protein kinase
MSAASRLCTPPALPGYTRASDELGGGGANGLVYRERDEASGEIVAVKYLYRAELTLVAHPNGKPPFQRELRNHALTGGHPLIAGFRRVELLQDWMAVVMELCEGANLLQWLNTQPRNRASEDVARGVVGQVLSAVHHMHSQNLAHRDLKARRGAARRVLCRSACAQSRSQLTPLSRCALPACAARQHLRDRAGGSRRGADAARA